MCPTTCVAGVSQSFRVRARLALLATSGIPPCRLSFDARQWPADVQSYTRDMEDPNIEFTCKGDREYVAYIFNKMSFDPRVAVPQ